MDMKLLVSVIVPVYNVEKELPECIDSILKQTYQNIEVILIDDGSPDGSGAICDHYQKKDSRVHVYHKENGGLSDARNYGIARCRGEYLICVDSDDVIKNTLIENQLSLAKEHHADMVVSPYQKFQNNNELFVSEKIRTGYVDQKTALLRLLYQDKVFHTGAHCKLYKRSLFDDVQYPVGLFYEDLATTYRLILKANRIAFTTEKMYGYRIRSGSIMRQGYSPKKMSCIIVSRQFYQEIGERYPDLKTAASSRAFSVNRAIYLQIPLDKKEERKQIWNEMKKYRKTVLQDENARKREKLMVIISYCGPTIFSILSLPYRIQQMQH